MTFIRSLVEEKSDLQPKWGEGELHDSQMSPTSVITAKRIQAAGLTVLLFEKSHCSLICTFDTLCRSAHTLQGLRCLGDLGRRWLHSSQVAGPGSAPQGPQPLFLPTEER